MEELINKNLTRIGQSKLKGFLQKKNNNGFRIMKNKKKFEKWEESQEVLKFQKIKNQPTQINNLMNKLKK